VEQELKTYQQNVWAARHRQIQALDLGHANGLALELLDSCQKTASDSSRAFDLDLRSYLCFAAA
jgi:hypothetical protein